MCPPGVAPDRNGGRCCPGRRRRPAGASSRVEQFAESRGFCFELALGAVEEIAGQHDQIRPGSHGICHGVTLVCRDAIGLEIGQNGDTNRLAVCTQSGDRHVRPFDTRLIRCDQRCIRADRRRQQQHHADCPQVARPGHGVATLRGDQQPEPQHRRHHGHVGIGDADESEFVDQVLADKWQAPPDSSQRQPPTSPATTPATRCHAFVPCAPRGGETRGEWRCRSPRQRTRNSRQ